MYYIDKLRIIKHIIIIQSVIHSPTGLFKESVNIIKELRASETLKQKIYALLIVLAGKVVDPAQLESAWEEVKLMGNKILEYAEERGLKLGEERGENRKAEEVALKMIDKNYDPQTVMEFTGISLKRLREISGQ